MMKKKILVLTYAIVGSFFIVLAFFTCSKIFKKEYNIEVIEDIKLNKVAFTWKNMNNIEDYSFIYSLYEFDDEDLINKINNKEELTNDIKKIDLGNINNYTLNNLINDTTYYYLIVGKMNDEYIKLIDVKSIHTPSSITQEITNFRVTEINPTSVKLEWNEYKFENVEENINIIYELSVMNNETNDYELISDNISDLYYVVSDLNSFTNYNFQIKAKIKMDDNIIESTEIKTTEIKTLPTPPENIKATSTNSSITLSWNKYNINENESVKYEVYGANKEDGDYILLSNNLKKETFSEENLKEETTRYYYILTIIEANNQTYTSPKSEIIKCSTIKKTTTTTKKTTTTTKKTTTKKTTTKSSDLTSAQKEAEARKIAKEIAKKATGSTDLEKIQSAAYLVSEYANRAVYTNEDKDYKTAYGVFVKGVYTCAGTARALGMVLEEMGYKWEHVNANKYTHQWVKVTIDGKVGWADAFPTLRLIGPEGMAGFGEYPYV